MSVDELNDDDDDDDDVSRCKDCLVLYQPRSVCQSL